MVEPLDTFGPIHPEFVVHLLALGSGHVFGSGLPYYSKHPTKMGQPNSSPLQFPHRGLITPNRCRARGLWQRQTRGGKARALSHTHTHTHTHTQLVKSGTLHPATNMTRCGTLIPAGGHEHCVASAWPQ